MKKPPRLLAVIAVIAVLAGATGALAAADIKLPPETFSMRDSPLAGHDVAVQKCGICHSSDYVDYQPPQMTKAQWTAEMAKMQHLYGAPISDDEVRLLGIYLAAAYGDANTVTAEDRALQPVAEVGPARAAVPDAATLLTNNGCLACHAPDHRIVGPAYHDVALKYRGDAQAVAKVAANIRAGGAGRWGPAPMPPFGGLSADDAAMLARFVMAQ